jgi:uncharacterized OB-fold protein
MTITFNPFPQQGWECPKCGRVYSPSTIMCVTCPAQQWTTTEATTHVCDFSDDTTVPTCRICGQPKPPEATTSMTGKTGIFTVSNEISPRVAHPDIPVLITEILGV